MLQTYEPGLLLTWWSSGSCSCSPSDSRHDSKSAGHVHPKTIVRQNQVTACTLNSCRAKAAPDRAVLPVHLSNATACRLTWMRAALARESPCSVSVVHTRLGSYVPAAGGAADAAAVCRRASCSRPGHCRSGFAPQHANASQPSEPACMAHQVF